MIISIKVTPQARQSKVLGFENGVLKVHVMAPPDKGEANKELIAVLSAFLGISKSRIIVLRGTTSRLKTVELTEFTQEELLTCFKK